MRKLRSKSYALVALFLLGGLEPALGFTPGATAPAGQALACPARDRLAASAALPVVWRLNPTLGSNLRGELSSVVSMLNDSFAAWTTAPNTNLAAARGADATTRDHAADGQNVLSFTPTQPLGIGVLAVTFTIVSDVAGEEFPAGSGQRSQFVGQILDADILFNANENFAVPLQLNSPSCLDANSNNICWDLQSVATHEIGHLFGLSHTGVWGAMVWPFAPPQGTFARQLSADDQAGIASLYPSSSFAATTGQISGRVLTALGARTFGAHVVAVDAASGSTVVSTIAAGTCVNNQMNYDGSFLIEGLPPGEYQLFAEPLDGPSTQGDYNSFFGGFLARPAVDTGFATRPH